MNPNPHEKLEKFPLAELLKGIPGLVGIQLDEEPSYEVLKKSGDLEIRKYAPMTLAFTEVEDGDFKERAGQAFVKLANYLFIKNDKKEEMSMTSPVLLKKTSSGWRMSFVLSKNFSGSQSLAPIDPLVHLEEVREKTYAVISYSGNMSEELLNEKNKEVLEKVKSQSEVKVLGSPLTAQYDQPFSVPFLKKNETWVEIST